MHGKSRPNITLSDLFASLAIVTLLTAIVSPILFNAQRSNNVKSCLSNMGKLVNGVLLYVQDYDERMPAIFATIPPINGGNVAAIPYDMQILPYISHPPGSKLLTFICPNDTTPLPPDAIIDNWDGNLRHPPYARRSYVYAGAINTQARADAGGGQPDPNTGMSQWGAGNSLAAMDNLGETIALTEGWAQLDGFSSAYAVGSPWGSILTSCDTWRLPGRNKPPENSSDIPPSYCVNDYNNPMRIPAVGHNHLGNYALADGHLATYSWQQVRNNDFSLFKLRK